jgi:uncharacterized protein YjbI with pentapeptide repeats
LYQPAKTVWDWLQLLVVPLVLAGAALWFNARQSRTEQQINLKQNALERELAQDQQRETALQSYLDRMAEMLLKEHLRTSQEGDEVRQIARVRTLTILRALDARRNAIVLRFLQEAGLREEEQPIVDLRHSALREVAFQGASLMSLNFKEFNLREANLSGAILHGAVLSGADMHQADLSGAILRDAVLSKANLSGANLSDADLSGANLSDATITAEQLKTVKSLEGATMPDGTKHS